MNNLTLDELIQKTHDWLVDANYAKGTISSFRSVTNQLKKYFSAQNESCFSIDLGLIFLEEHYNLKDLTEKSKKPACLRFVEMLSDMMLHGFVMIKKRKRKYTFPEAFCDAVASYNERRIAIEIKEDSVIITQLYLERFFDFLAGKGIASFDKIDISIIYEFISALNCFSKQTAAANLRAVKFFLECAYKNGFFKKELYKKIPCIHYNKSSALPSVYSEAEVLRVIDEIDLGNPCGKRDYAIIMLITRLGLRASDVANLKFENIEWEANRIRLYQIKTKKSLELPLLKDVGEAVIEYMRYGRPDSDSAHVFIRHRAPIQQFTASAVGTMVYRYLLKSGIEIEGRHHGSHALRHSLAGRLLENKVPLPVISEILGHSQTETTMTYLRVDIEQLKKCALEVAAYDN